MWEAIGASLAILLFILREIFKVRQERKEASTYDNDIAQMDNALASGNADDIALAFERLRRKSRYDPGGQDGKAPT